ncbi:MAG: 6-phosphogluconolactonase [Polyangia bacterium]
MTAPEIIVLEDAAAVAADAVRRFIQVCSRGERVNIAMAGGSTPKAAYHLLGGPHSGDVHWGRTALYFGDERCVPPTDEQSNYRMVKDALLDPLLAKGIKAGHVERMEGELDPDEAASRYAGKVEAVTFDLVMLGMGPDGHTASLFPGAAELAKHGVALATEAPHLGVRRLTLTYDKINAARLVLVTVTGAEKAESLAKAVNGPPGAVPLRDVRPTQGNLVIVCDRQAASRLA